ncbi:uroporphyrinogen decarboxylase family protein [Eubacterium sp. F2]|uniref:uroporphyrinogen decarboxylase family protein n=1 Tax=Eubacterium sp. F2 TaxID=3381348 RepID=UPI0039082871
MDLIRLEMTPKERAKAYAMGKEVDRIPTNLSAGETAPPLYGYDICDYYFSADAMVAVESGLAEDFQADNMGIGLGLRTLSEALGCKLEYPKKRVSYIVKPAFTSWDEMELRELVDVRKDGRFPIITEAFQRLMDKYGSVRNFGSGLAGPFTTAASLVGTEKFLISMIKEKGRVHQLLQYSTDCVVKCCKELHEILGINFMLSEPMGSKNMIGKRQFDEFFLPYLNQAVKRMNQFQGKTSLHICGKTRDRWDEVVDSGICNFWVDNCEDLRELKDNYGDRIGITGNIPPVDVLKLGTKEDIYKAIRESIQKAGDNPMGYTICPGCTTPEGTTKENMIYFMNAAAIYGKGARKGYLPKGILENQ